MSLPAAALPHALVDRCIAGDAAAWRELHRAYYPQVVTFLKRLGVPPRESEDVAQDVFVQVARYLKTFERRAELRTWIYKLCISESNRWRRRKLWLFWNDERVADQPVGLGLSDHQALRVVREALAAMKPDVRTTFVLFELEGVAGDEIARITDVPIGTVWRRLHEGREHFKRYIEDPPLRRKEPTS